MGWQREPRWVVSAVVSAQALKWWANVWQWVLKWAMARLVALVWAQGALKWCVRAQAHARQVGRQARWQGGEVGRQESWQGTWQAPWCRWNGVETLRLVAGSGSFFEGVQADDTTNNIWAWDKPHSGGPPDHS